MRRLDAPLHLLGLLGLLLLSGCQRESGEAAIHRRFGTQARKITTTPGFARTVGGFSRSYRGAEAAVAADPVRAAEAALERRAEGLELTLPERGSDAAVLTFPGLRVELRELGLSGTGELAGTAVTYPRSGGAAYWASGRDHVEEWILAEDAGKGPVAEWEVSGATLRQRGAAVELLDAGGVARARVTAPIAWREDGSEVHAWLRVEEGRLALYTAGRGAVLVDPVWQAVGAPTTMQQGSTLTLLPTGKLLMAGGGASYGVEIYDPATNSWVNAPGMTRSRTWATATVLRDGRVLVVGDYGGGLPSDLFDPRTGTWSTGGSIAAQRNGHSATLLLNGNVLIAGGNAGTTQYATAELYDPATDLWTATGSMASPRNYHTATMLPDGKVLVTGGGTATAETYDPSTRLWSLSGAMPLDKSFHNAVTLPSGKVLVTGGDASALLYDYTLRTFAPTASLTVAPRYGIAALLPNGKVFFKAYDAGQLFDPGLGGWSAPETAPEASNPAYVFPSTMLPTGQLLTLAWPTSTSAGADTYDPAVPAWSAPAGALTTARSQQTLTLLSTGKVLVAGGFDGAAAAVKTAELFDPATGLFSPTGNLVVARAQHTATTLASGKILLAGGKAAGAPLASSELYDPAAGTFQATTGPMAAARSQQTATLLGTGKVLVAGGLGAAAPLLTAELFDPAAGTWSATGSLGTARSQHAAVLMPSGLVRIVGGLGATAALASVEEYEPGAGIFTVIAGLAAPRYAATATLLPSGALLVAGGQGTAGLLGSAELLPAGLGATWVATGSLSSPRAQHAATLIPSGKVLVTGGLGAAGATSSADLYDPIPGTWSPLPTLSAARYAHGAATLPSGRVLITGGVGPNALASAELFDEGRGASLARTPVVTGASSPAGASTVVADAGLTLAGTLFTGTGEASDGRGGSSATNYPLISLERADGGPPAYAPLTAFSATSATGKVPRTLLPGPYWARVTVSGILSNAVFVTVTPPLVVTPAATTSPPRGTLIFTTTGGAGATGVTWTMKSKPSGGTITNSTTQPGAGVYVAGTVPNQTDLVQAQDAQGNLATATVTVTAMPSISPASVTLPPSGSQLFTFTGGSGVLGAWSLSTPQYGGSIGASSGAYRAGPGGNVTDVVVVTDSLGNTASRNVTVTAPPAIAPATVSTWPRGTVTLTASAGSGTGFGWDFLPGANLSNGTVLPATPTTATYTAGTIGGVTDTVRLTDDLFNVTTRNVTVTAGLTLNPTTWSLAPRATKAFTVSGGSGTGYAWSLPTKGSGSPSFNVTSGTTVTYQAGPTGSSADLVQVSDSAGNIATAPVTITAGLSISPASATVQTGLTQAFTPSGGSTTSYQWIMVTNGSVTGKIDPTTGLYTAGSTPGADVIRLTDSLTNVKTATITVVAPVTVTPSPASSPPRGSITFLPSGGSGAPYTFTPKTPPLASGGNVTASGNYTAGATPNVTDLLQVADSAGTTATINVTVGPGITITPAGSSSVAPRGAISFGATGGKGAPYGWVVLPKPSGGSIDPLTGAYQAGTTGGVADTVTVTDSLGNSATRSVAVSAAATVTPGNVTLQYGKTQVFSASLGAGGFNWTLVGTGLGSIAPTSGASTTYTAGTVSGTDTLQATDANNVVVSRTITLVPTLSVATLPASVPPRGARDFTASGGAGAPYTFTPTTPPLPSGGSVTGAGHYLAGAIPGVTDVLQVADALGAITSFEVTVTGGVTILPAGASSSWPKGALTFTPSGGSGSGFWFAPVTMNSGGTINTAGQYLAGATGDRIDTVQLTDSLGNVATRDVAVGPLPTLSPASLLVAPGAARTLTGSGGSGSFASWAVSPATGGGVTASSATTATYTAGTTPGDYQVQATDTASNVASASVTVLAPLQIGPGPVSLPPRKAQQFTASGGSSAGSGYQWVLTSRPSGGSVDPVTGAYAAGTTGGVVDVLQLTDGIGTTASISIDVTPGVAISPASLTLAPGGSWDFTASGGDGLPYAFDYATGGKRSGGSLTTLGGYTAGATEGVTDDLVASDLLGNVATVSVLVSSAFQVLPAAPVSVPPRGTIDFDFAGGSGAGYAWSLLTDGSGGSINPSTGVYKAGAKGSSSAVVEVVDSLQHKAQRAVTVTAGVSIAPGGASLLVRETQKLSASGGSATGWIWTFRNNRSGASLSGTGGSRTYTAGAIGGVVDEVTVTDSLDNFATIAVSVEKENPLSCGNTSGLPSALGLVGVALLVARRRRRLLPAAGVLLLLLLPALAAAAPKGSASTAVLDLVADQGVEPRVARVATDTLVTELQARAGVPVITERDIRASMSFEQRKAVACSGKDEDCLIEVGGALGVDFIIIGSIAKLDDTYVVSVQAFDERKTVVVRRFQQRSKGISEAGVLDLIEEAARRLAPVLPGSRAVEPAGQGAAPVAVAEPLVIKPAAPPPAQKVEPPAPAPAKVEPAGQKLAEELPPAPPPPPPPPPPPEGFLVVLRAATPTDGLGLLGALELGARISNRWDLTGGAMVAGKGRAGATLRTTVHLFNVEGHVRPCIGLAGVALFGNRTDLGLLGSLGIEFRGQSSGFLVELPFLSLLGGPRDTRTSWLLAGVAINWRP
jgi:hypothetical protein